VDRRELFRNVVLAGAGLSIQGSVNLNAKEEVPGSMGRIRNAAAAGLAMERRDWEQGILAQAFLEAGDERNVVLLTKAAIVQRVPDGRLAVVIEGGPTDPAMGGVAYWRAGQITGDAGIQEAVEGLLKWLLKDAPRATDGTLYHVFKSPEVWADGFNGAPPFLAATGHYDEALHQIDGFQKRLWDPKRQLLSHIWIDSEKADNHREYWGGGNGWAAAGLARVIRALPEERKNERQRLQSFLIELIEGCLAYQRTDGLFHDVLDRPETFVEANLAQMLAFAVYTGLAGGWMPARYRDAADKMRSAARGKMDSFGYVQSVCGAPNFDRQGTSTEAQAFAIMMEAAASKLK
jgi:unsaturated rhamnogalacturonyl hydrolase